MLIPETLHLTSVHISQAHLQVLLGFTRDLTVIKVLQLDWLLLRESLCLKENEYQGAAWGVSIFHRGLSSYNH